MLRDDREDRVIYPIEAAKIPVIGIQTYADLVGNVRPCRPFLHCLIESSFMSEYANKVFGRGPTHSPNVGGANQLEKGQYGHTASSSCEILRDLLDRFREQS